MQAARCTGAGLWAEGQGQRPIQVCGPVPGRTWRWAREEWEEPEGAARTPSSPGCVAPSWAHKHTSNLDDQLPSGPGGREGLLGLHAKQENAGQIPG